MTSTWRGCKYLQGKLHFSPSTIGSILVLQILKCNNLVPSSIFCPFITCIFGPLKYGVGLILVPEVGFLDIGSVRFWSLKQKNKCMD